MSKECSFMHASELNSLRILPVAGNSTHHLNLNSYYQILACPSILSDHCVFAFYPQEGGYMTLVSHFFSMMASQAHMYFLSHRDLLFHSLQSMCHSDHPQKWMPPVGLKIGAMQLIPLCLRLMTIHLS